jgi:hypothetical protein
VHEVEKAQGEHRGHAPPASRSVDYRLVVRESTGGTAGVRLEAVAGGGETASRSGKSI